MLAFVDIKWSARILAHLGVANRFRGNAMRAHGLKSLSADSRPPRVHELNGASPPNSIRAGAHGRALEARRRHSAGRLRPVGPPSCVHDRNDDASAAAREEESAEASEARAGACLPANRYAR